MATILELAELVWRNLNPNNSAQSAIKKEEVVSAALSEYASSMWIYSKELQLSDGGFEVPSILLTTKDFDIVNNMVDLSDEPILNSLPNDQSIVSVGDDFGDCSYVKSTLGQEKKLRDDDSLGDKKTVYRSGKKLIFPRGVYNKKVSITYANDGSGADGEDVDVNDYVASRVRDKLYQIYGIKVPADMTQNSNPNG